MPKLNTPGFTAEAVRSKVPTRLRWWEKFHFVGESVAVLE